MKFFKPEMMYSGQLNFAEIPEASRINTETKGEIGSQMQSILDFMKWNGIALGLGINSNRDSFFDLYAPFVDILLDEPAAVFGSTRESEVGKMHFLTHDSVHLYMGMPGPRLQDLKNRDGSKERLKKILMRIEALASVWTSINHIKWYWQWRRENQGLPVTEEFQKYNQGLRYIGNFTDSDYTNLVEAYMSGRAWEMKKIFSKVIDFGVFEKARQAGVPMLFPDFRPKLTPTGEKFLIQHLFPFVLPYVHMTDSKFGYINLWKYADIQADFYLSPWYVRWADTFQIGETLDSLEKSLERKSQDLKQGRLFTDARAPREGQFELAYLRNHVAQFGRKLIEFETLAEMKGIALTENHKVVLGQLLKSTVSLNTEVLNLLQSQSRIDQNFISLRTQAFRGLRSAAAKELPIHQIIPSHQRLPHADYTNFWHDSFAVLMARPEGLTKFLSAKGIWEVARQQRLERLKAISKGQQPRPIDFSSPPELVADLERQLAGRYNLRRSAQVLAEQFLHENYYVNRLLNYQAAVRAQVQQVFEPQVYEFSQLGDDEKKEITRIGKYLLGQLDAKFQLFANDYQRLFVRYERDSSAMNRIVGTESDLKWAIDRALHEMSDVLDKLSEGKPYRDIKGSLERISSIASQIENGQSVSRGVNDLLRNLLPYKKGTIKTVCSLITRLCLAREPLSKYLDQISTQSLTGDQKKKVKIAFVDKNNVETGRPLLPANAIVIMALNHDHALLDLNTMKQLEKALDFQAGSVLTNLDVWPMYKFLENRDEHALFRQSPNLKSKVIKLADQVSGRYMFAIYPEGDLPYFGAQFPTLSHLGAFSIARNLAIHFQQQRPVYLMKAFGNFSKVVSSREAGEFRLEVTRPELVPATPLANRDGWIETQRAGFERESNERRGRLMLDLVHREQDPARRVKYSSEVAPYRTVSDFMQEELDVSNRIKGSVSCETILKAK
ncbi:MAG: hypothetical protein ACK5Y2_00065 [Bdellovibrionales bacterium]